MLPSYQIQVIEQANCTYSPSGKALEKKQKVLKTNEENK